MPRLIVLHGGTAEITPEQAEELCLFTIKRALARGYLHLHFRTLAQLQRSKNEVVRREALRLALLGSLRATRKKPMDEPPDVA